MATRPYQHEVPFGVVDDGGDGAVTRDPREAELDVDVNAGVYAMSPHVLDLRPPRCPEHMPELIEACLDDDEPVAAWAMRSDWIDVGTPADLARAKGGT